jgi:NADH-quinone oxidoreductase subunit M
VTDLPWLTVLGILPLVGAALVAALPARLAKAVTLGTSLVVLGATIVMCAAFDAAGPRFQFVQEHDWIPAFGVQYAVGVDGIALVLVALVAVLVPVVVVASWDDVDAAELPAGAALSASGTGTVSTASAAPATGASGGTATAVLEAPPVAPPAGGRGGSRAMGRSGSAPGAGRVRSVKSFFGLLLVLETMMIGVFAATDVFLFYVFFEAVLIPMYFLIGSYGGPRRSYAAVKFLLYSLVGGLLMLAAVIGLYVTSAEQGTGTFNFAALTALEISTPVQIALFLGFFIAFAIKAPLFPFHTWLPDSGAEAPVGAAVLLVGVLDKIGTYGFLRYCLPLFPDASRILAPYVIALCVIGILYGALLAMGQKDMKRLVSYTSVAHFGFIGMGCFAFTTQAQSGAVLYMVNHGLSTGALFLVVGFLVVRGRSRNVDDYSGVARVAPVLAGLFLVAGLSSLALPGLSTFVSEFLVLLGTYTRYPVAAVIATVGIVFAALYVLLLFQRTMQGTLLERHARMPDLRGREVLAVAPLVALMLVLGFYPKPMLDVINPAVEATLQDVGVSDPAPTAADAAAGENR